MLKTELELIALGYVVVSASRMGHVSMGVLGCARRHTHTTHVYGVK